MPLNRRHRVGIAEPLMQDLGIYQLRIEAFLSAFVPGADDDAGSTALRSVSSQLAETVLSGPLVLASDWPV